MDVEESGGRVALRLKSRPRTEQVAFGKLMAALSLMKGSPWPEFQISLVEDRTAHIAIAVLARAIGKLVDAGGWRPDVESILQACEAARLEIRNEAGFVKCESCTPQGFVEFTDPKGVKRMKKCECWHAHQAKLAQLPAGKTPLALPPAIERDFTQAGE